MIDRVDEVRCDENPQGSNQSSNPHLNDLIQAQLDRRTVLAGALGAAAVQFLAGSVATTGRASASSLAGSGGGGAPTLGFTEVPPSSADTFVVPAGYTAKVIIPWGTPILAGAASFQEDASNSAADQAGQVGFNHDGIHFYRFPTNPNRRGLLVLNHEYTDATQIYTAAQGPSITNNAAGREKVAKALEAHGVTVVELRRDSTGNWKHLQGSPYNRRITGTTPMTFSGPVSANHPLLQSTVVPTPIGTLNNCGSGTTPWGTYLTAEENFNGYFGANGSFTATPLQARYGISASGFGYGWHIAEPRFDLNANPNEPNRFGWIVEIDPFNPTSTPVKRTALGRFKHEAAYVTVSAGVACVYSGDDENGDYVYKFVSDAPWAQMIGAGQSPLDFGKLYVAKFNANGTGDWLLLEHGNGPLTVANGWADQADVLIRTRQAADALGATRCHRPEWVCETAQTQDVYVAFTNGTGNNAPVNSNRDPNPYGHIVRLRETGGDHRLTTFDWSVFLLAGDNQYDPLVPASQTLFGSPDGIWADPDGRLWIQTDISNSSQNRQDRGYDRIANNMMLVSNPATGELKRFLTGPRGCEITGVCMSTDKRTLFVNVQHPGESTNFWNGLFGAPTNANPSSVSTWPFGGRPRPATVSIQRIDGGLIGT
jgi:secreted PhoX family phosphatase